MDGRIAKGQETKEKIISGALTLISEQGMTGLSAKKIADRAGVSKSNLFHHFSTVEVLLEVILGGISAGVIKDLKIEECENLKHFFTLLGEGTFNLKGNDLVIYRTLYAFYHEAVFKDSYREQIIEVKNGMRDYFVDIIERLTGKHIDISLADLITMDLDGMGMHYMIEQDSEKYLQLWRQKSKLYIMMITDAQ